MTIIYNTVYKFQRFSDGSCLSSNIFRFLSLCDVINLSVSVSVYKPSVLTVNLTSYVTITLSRVHLKITMFAAFLSKHLYFACFESLLTSVTHTLSNSPRIVHILLAGIPVAVKKYSSLQFKKSK